MKNAVQSRVDMQINRIILEIMSVVHGSVGIKGQTKCVLQRKDASVTEVEESLLEGLGLSSGGEALRVSMGIVD